nr:Phosphotransferase enzyme family [uncultured bacterium]
MDTLAIARNQAFNQLAEAAVRQYCKTVHEITYIEHGADNLIILVNHEFVFRFPRDDGASRRLFFETALLQKLAGKVTTVTIPSVVQVHHQPLFVVAPYTEGVHLDGRQIQSLSQEEQTAVGETIAQFVVELNQAISGAEVSQLRQQAGVVHADGAWEPYFERLFALQPLPNAKLQPLVNEFYPLWKDYLKHQDRTLAIHDDLHPVNLLFMGPRLTGVLDFGDANTGGIEEELRWLYLMGDVVLGSAIAKYQELTGKNINHDHVRVWAIMHELSSYVRGLARQETEQFPFKRAEANLKAWLPNFPV